MCRDDRREPMSQHTDSRRSLSSKAKLVQEKEPVGRPTRSSQDLLDPCLDISGITSIGGKTTAIRITEILEEPL